MKARLLRWLPALAALALAVPAAIAFNGWMVWPAVALALVAGERSGRALRRRIVPPEEAHRPEDEPAPRGPSP